MYKALEVEFIISRKMLIMINSNNMKRGKAEFQFCVFLLVAFQLVLIFLREVGCSRYICYSDSALLLLLLL